MKQYDAVIQVMESNGGYATLGFLYSAVLKIAGVEWKTKTPFASIRRIVQNGRYFFKIRPGLWALNTYKGKLPPEIFPTKTLAKSTQEEYTHTYYQGLLVEIGNLKKYQTFVPNQDKNDVYLGRKLCDVATVHDIYKFSYDCIIRRARTVDVTWFNGRNMPEKFFEVEHTTSIQNSLTKFSDLQDFYTNFYIVAASVRKNEFEDKVKCAAFSQISKRTTFLSYEHLSEWHGNTYRSVTLERSLGINL